MEEKKQVIMMTSALTQANGTRKRVIKSRRRNNRDVQAAQAKQSALTTMEKAKANLKAWEERKAKEAVS